MKCFAYFVFLVTYAFQMCVAQDAPVNKISIELLRMSHTGEITVKMTNISKQTIRVWQDSNSWGAAHWRVLVLRKNRLETFFQNPDQGFTVNMPSFVEMSPGAQREERLDLNGGNWCGLGFCSSYNQRGFDGQEYSFQKGDIVTVIYDVPKEYGLGSQTAIDARKMGVWYGVIAACTTFQ